MKYYFVIILLSIFINSYSQDTINLLNGNQIIAKSIFYEPASSMLKYDVIKKNKVKQKMIDRIDIYSIRFSDNTEKIFYYPDSIIGYTLSQSDMYDFILGEREAIKNYKKALDLKANDDYSALDLGKIYFDKKDYSNAQKYFEIVLKYAPTSDEAKEYLEKMK